MAPPIAEYQNPSRCPQERPALSSMHEETRSLHSAIDDAIRARGVPYLHPRDRTLMLDLLGSCRMTAWQEGKASFLFDGEGCWSELPQVYARYGVDTTRTLLERVRALENARGAILTDCGMQACALLFDALVTPGSHAVLMRQVYNKTRKYLERLCELVGGEVTVVDDGDYEGIARAVRQDTVLLFAETFTNPLMRAIDPERLGDLVVGLRKAKAPRLRLIADDTIASPWGLRSPLLDHEGIDFVVASGTKSLGGQDRDLWGYIASNRLDVLNETMDLQAMRGGILDWRRAEAILSGLEDAERNFDRRCASAERVAAFLASHPRVSRVFHPSLADHPDRAVIDRHYRRTGSLLSFRLRASAGGGEADEPTCLHFADVLATCIVPRYALSFDGLTSKVNHHRTVSEYFTPTEELARAGIDRLIRLGVGLEQHEDVVACLNWSLWNHDRVSAADVESWQRERARDLGIYQSGGAS